MKTSAPILVEAAPPTIKRLPRPDQLSLLKLEFDAYAFENAKGDHDAAALMKLLEKTPVIIMLPRYYQNLGHNTSEFIRFIEQLMALVEAYEAMIEGEDEGPER